jgi:hypothetical protein
MVGFDFNKELEEIKQIKDKSEVAGWLRRKYYQVYMNAKKYPKTAFAVGLILGFLAGKIF